MIIRGEFVQRRDTAARWASFNPVLRDGEIGLDTDADQFKMGDGVTHWVDLAFYGGGGSTDLTAVLSRLDALEALNAYAASTITGATTVVGSGMRVLTLSGDSTVTLSGGDGSIVGLVVHLASHTLMVEGTPVLTEGLVPFYRAEGVWRMLTAAGGGDITPPAGAYGLANTNVTDTTATFGWTAGTDSESTVTSQWSTDGITWVDVGAAVTKTLTGLTPNTAGTFRVRSHSEGGNSTPVSVGFTTNPTVVINLLSAMQTDSPIRLYNLNASASPIASIGSDTTNATMGGNLNAGAALATGFTASTEILSGSGGETTPNAQGALTEFTFEALFSIGDVNWNMSWLNFGNGGVGKVVSNIGVGSMDFEFGSFYTSGAFTTAFAANTPTLVAIRLKADQVSFWINGAKIKEASAGGQTLAALSSYYPVGFMFTGNIGRTNLGQIWGMYGTALSDARLLAHAQAAGRA